MASSAELIDGLLDEVMAVSHSAKVHNCYSIEDAVAKVTEQADGDSVIVFTQNRFCDYAVSQLLQFGFSLYRHNKLKSRRGLIFRDRTTVRLASYVRGSHALRGFKFDHIFVGLF